MYVCTASQVHVFISCKPNSPSIHYTANAKLNPASTIILTAHLQNFLRALNHIYSTLRSQNRSTLLLGKLFIRAVEKFSEFWVVCERMARTSSGRLNHYVYEWCYKFAPRGKVLALYELLEKAWIFTRRIFISLREKRNKLIWYVN